MRPTPIQAVRWPADDARWVRRALHYTMGVPFRFTPRAPLVRARVSPWAIGLYLTSCTGFALLAIKIIARLVTP